MRFTERLELSPNLAPHLLHWKPLPLPSDFATLPHLAQMGLSRSGSRLTDKTSIFSMLSTGGCLLEALRTPP